MSDGRAAEMPRPAVGSAYTFDVQQSATRTTLFPEQTVVTGMPGEFVELIMLRAEPIVRSQTGIVGSVEQIGVQLTELKTNLMPQMFDIGHVRLPTNLAVSMAIAVLRQAHPELGDDLDKLEQQLTQPPAEAI